MVSEEPKGVNVYFVTPGRPDKALGLDTSIGVQDNVLMSCNNLELTIGLVERGSLDATVWTTVCEIRDTKLGNRKL